MKSLMRIFILCLCLTATLSAQGLPPAAAESVGLSRARLQRVENMMTQYVERKQIAGAVALVARKGKTAYVKSVGLQDIETKKPMQDNTIFRIASMTKPITSVAVMILHEEGRFRLDDPLFKYLPEFKDMKVLVDAPATNGKANADSLAPAKRPITIRHLLTHTAGFTYHWNERLGSLYDKAGIAHGLGLHDETLAESMKKLAGLPLMHQPGDKWEYGLSTDVLGYLVEVVSGKPFNEFLRERIFMPLKMNDTHFFLPENKAARLATVYQFSEEKGLVKVPDHVTFAGKGDYSPSYPVSGPQRYYSGGAGLSSTVADYARFAQMLLNGGELEGARILSRKSIELMTADFLKEKTAPFGFGFGLGFGIKNDVTFSGELGSVGAYGWSGAWYTRFWIDPAEQMVALIMVQLPPFTSVDLNQKFPTLVYQAIVD
ncbi:MAG: serine hydrolase domain-containing protein [candidate division KSB1 bacterium]